MSGILDRIVVEIKDLKEKEVYRSLRPLIHKNGTIALLNGKEVLLFCTNDYLGLSQNPVLKKAAMRAIEEWGIGGTASRLIAGNLSIFEELERRLARFKEAEAALTFSSGYTTNLGVISTLARSGDLILSDQLNHASIVDACRLSKAEVVVYPHLDMEALERSLKEKKANTRFIVTDGVFSMDGDLAPLPQLLSISKEYEATLIVDDAHATGVIGPNGKGSFEYWDLSPEGTIQVGTFSKAFGTQGGFVAAPKAVVSYLVNKARPFIYSTALSPTVVGATLASLELIEEAKDLRVRLLKLCTLFRDGLKEIGIHLPPLPTPIFAIVLGKNQEATKLSEHLLEHGIYVPAIRPPTVPEGQSRIRVSLCALHTEVDIERLLWGISSFFKRGA